LTPEPTGDVSNTSIAEVGLSIDEAFGYWFDFGDDWWHQINVTNILDKAPTGKYPRITKRVGASPPQYADFE
jgi:Plasmid pRiA4b ORF-3-like protein